MEAQALKLCYRTFSNQELGDSMQKLEQQMQGLDPGSLEWQYDEVQLANEKNELKIREENPDLDPMTQAGAAALAAKNTGYQSFEDQIKAILQSAQEQGDNYTSWAIPM